MDPDRVREIVGSIPRGAWMSYGDVARAAGVSRSTVSRVLSNKAAAGGTKS